MQCDCKCCIVSILTRADRQEGKNVNRIDYTRGKAEAEDNVNTLLDNFKTTKKAKRKR